MIDYRIFEPDSDGKSKMEHVQDMLKNVEYSKKLTFTTVLMDAWYASNKIMLFISDMQKRFYCPIKSNRLARESGNTEYYKKITELSWTEEELHTGKSIRRQCRKQCIQRNHIACAILVWSRLKQIAYKTSTTVYKLKHLLLHEYLVSELKSPRINMSFA